MKKFGIASLMLMVMAAPAFATVTVTTPANDETSGSAVHFEANATTSCSKGISSMGIYVNGDRQYVVPGASLNTTLSLGPGTYNTVIEEWDGCGGASTAARTVKVSTGPGVAVSTPSSGSTVSSPVPIVASATTSCSKGVSSMGVYVDGNRVYVAGGHTMNAQIPMSGGTHKAVVEEWDGCGGAATQQLTLNVSGGSGGKSLSAIQAATGWDQWGELPPTDATCDAPCGGHVSFWMGQHEKNVSLSGNGTQFTISGNTPYADVLYSNPIMGQRSTLIPDTNHSVIPNLHNFTYTADVYVTNASVTQSLEFDINMYLDSTGMEWGTQCNHLGDGDWDIWNNVNAHWVSTGRSCGLKNGWNHVVLQVQRESNNDLLFQTITMNGTTYNINTTMAPFGVPSSWYGMTVNFQMDGDYNMHSYNAYLDNFSVNYW
ncbi:MAG TPA: Ig-like domain-containing protein [Acidobacteriaceae bacterium]